MNELPGGLLVLDGDEAVLVGQFIRAGHARVRSAYVGAGLPFPVEGEQLVAHFQARIDQRRREVPSPAQVVARVTSCDAAGSALVPAVAAVGSATAWSSWPPTEVAAKTLGISTSAVRKAIRSGRLNAVRDREGTGYLVEPESIATYRPRSARARRDDASAA